MIKKTMKKLVVMSVLSALALSVTACGKDDDKKETTEATTVATTEATTEAIADETTDDYFIDGMPNPDDTTEFCVCDDEFGFLYVKQFSFSIPDGYTLYSQDETLSQVILQNASTGDTLAITVIDPTGYTSEDIRATYDAQIKQFYGEGVTGVEKDILGYNFVIYDIGTYQGKCDVQAALLNNEGNVLYVEHAYVTGTESILEDFLATCSY